MISFSLDVFKGDKGELTFQVRRSSNPQQTVGVVGEPVPWYWLLSITHCNAL